MINFPYFIFAACQAKGLTLLPTWYEYLDETTVAGRCTPTFKFPESIPNIGLAIVDILLRVAILISVGYVIYGGFKYTLSQGDPEGAKVAKKTIINALIGVVITIVAASIVAFIGNSLGG